jgi:uncharacterized protein with NAD-binding domain and iron-sulfur cluster
VPKSATRTKVAVLGGGMAALTAAWELAKEGRYEITVYQQGWRLGGKGASGRNVARNARSEEHGLHVWFGCYETAFRVLRECYAAANLPRNAAFRSVDDAFRPQDHTPVGEFVAGRWRLWPINYPRNERAPGTAGETPIWADVLWENIRQLVEHADRLFDDWRQLSQIREEVPIRTPLAARLWLAPPAVRLSEPLLKQACCVVRAPQADRQRNYGRGLAWLFNAFQTWRHRRALLWSLRRFQRLRQEKDWLALGNDEVRRSLIAVDLAVAVVRGLIADGALFCGLEALDGEDLRAWLRRHGAAPDSVWSGFVRAIYDLVFAYEDGEAGSGTAADPGRPNFAAGTALSIILRIALGYRGAVCYELQAGMGETVFTPMYRALLAKGVRFEFFHRVKRIELTPDGTSVGRIYIARQVDLVGPTYRPTINVNGLECWPTEPDYAQIRNGEALRGINLESRWSGWNDVADVTLEAESDFHEVVLGIPLAGLTSVCTELVHRDRRWRNMLRKMKTVQTQSVQLWMTRSLNGLGWPRGRVPVNAAPEPLDVWMDMSQVLATENWPANNHPQSIQYLCGPLPGNYMALPENDHTAVARAHAVVRSTAKMWLERYAGALWPNAVQPGTDALDWQLLHAPHGRSEADRLDDQYLRANIDPSERYVLSVAGSTRYRLAPGESGYRNLFLAGDWTRTLYNAGCIEAAAMSGVEAARALSGTAAADGAVMMMLLGLPGRIIRAMACAVFMLLRLLRRRLLPAEARGSASSAHRRDLTVRGRVFLAFTRWKSALGPRS